MKKLRHKGGKKFMWGIFAPNGHLLMHGESQQLFLYPTRRAAKSAVTTFVDGRYVVSKLPL